MKPYRQLRMAAVVLALAVSTFPGITASQDVSAYMAVRERAAATQSNVASAVRANAQTALRGDYPLATNTLSRIVQMSLRQGSDSYVGLEVFIYAHKLPPIDVEALEQHEVRIRRADYQFHIVHATVPVEALDAVAALPFVRWIGPPSQSVLNAGSVTAEGDAVMRAADARALFGIDGRGVRVGIISDSLIDLRASAVSGDLPPNVAIVNARDGSHLVGPSDEGRAMAEIVHDLAPGAELLFHSGFPTSLDLIAAIRALTVAGAHIIVDDVLPRIEPAFTDGPVAQAAQEAVDSGVVYITGASHAGCRRSASVKRRSDR
jgi:hypothetical protein